MGQKDSLQKEWQPTPVFLPGESHGQRRLAGYSPWGCKESDTTKQHTRFGRDSATAVNDLCSEYDIPYFELINVKSIEGEV